jgi:hypothetical protein
MFLPSSVYEIYDLLTTGSKQGIMFVGICQHEDQVYQPAFEHIYTKIFVGRYIYSKNNMSEMYDLAKTLMWNPNAKGGIGVRECLLYNKNGEWAKFMPNECCCRC